MKKVICLILALLFCVCLAACDANSDGNGATNDSATNDSVTVDSDGASSDIEAATAAPDTHYDSIDDYLKNPQVQNRIKEESEGAESIVKMNVYAQEDTLVYEYTYVDHISEDNIGSTKESIDNALNDNASFFLEGVGELRQYVGLDNPKVKVVYLNDDGSVITEMTFEDGAGDGNDE